MSARSDTARIFPEWHKVTLSPLQQFAVGVGDDHLFGEWRVTRYDVRAILGDGDGNLLLG